MGMADQRKGVLQGTEALAYDEWRNKVRAHLPAVAARVFALRGKPYSGSERHHGLERALGGVLTCASDDKAVSAVDAAIDEALWRDLLRRLIRAEFSARGWDFPRRPL